MNKRQKESVNKIFKSLRKKHSLTQQKMADVLGMYVSYYVLVENGLRPIHPDKIKILDDVFKLSATKQRVLLNSRKRLGYRRLSLMQKQESANE